MSDREDPITQADTNENILNQIKRLKKKKKKTAPQSTYKEGTFPYILLHHPLKHLLINIH